MLSNKSKERWKDLGIKDKIQYITAILLLISGIVMAFLSFFLNQFDIASGVLIYIAQCFITAGGIFGVSIYFNTKLGEFKSSTKEQINNLINLAVQQLDE